MGYDGREGGTREVCKRVVLSPDPQFTEGLGTRLVREV